LLILLKLGRCPSRPNYRPGCQPADLELVLRPSIGAVRFRSSRWPIPPKRDRHRRSGSDLFAKFKGQWLPGASPNPSGRPRGAIRHIRAICLNAAEDLLHELIELAMDPNVRPRDRISATSIILERGLGKASPEVADDETEAIDQKGRIMKLISPELRKQLGFNRNGNSTPSALLPHGRSARATASIQSSGRSKTLGGASGTDN